MLLNLVRLRYNDTPLFLELGSVVAQYGYDASLNAGGTVRRGSSGTVGTALTYSRETDRHLFAARGRGVRHAHADPIPLDSIMLFEQSGWSADRLLLVTVQRVNDVFNAPTAAGPTPARKPDYEAFADFAERLQRLRSAGLSGSTGSRRNMKPTRPDAIPTSGCTRRPTPTARSPQMSPRSAATSTWSRAETISGSPAFPFKRQPTEVGLRCRSLLGVLYFLSQSVEPPDAGRPGGPGHGHRGRRRAAVRLVEGHGQGHAHPLAAGPAAEGLHRRPATAAGGSTSPTTTRARRPPSAC